MHDDQTAVLTEWLQAARGAPNRGLTHIFLGDPRSDLADKTTVEPGNVYSPGLWTCGISVQFRIGSETMSAGDFPPDRVGWTLIAEPGGAPVAESRYAAQALDVVHRLAHLGGEGAEGVDFNRIDVTARSATTALLALIVRDVGPAGGRISGLAWDAPARTLTINDSLRLVVEQPPAAAIILPANASHDAPAAALCFRIDAQAGERFGLAFRTEHGFDERPFARSIPKRRPHAGLPADAAFARVASDWQAALPARVIAPDPRVSLAWERCAAHILFAMECGLPRIGVANYPVFWLRDGVIILRALDLIGQHDLARIGNDYLAPLVFTGGFGAESDAPGEGIWSLRSHARMTRDEDWGRSVFPDIRRRAVWIERMLAARAPLRAMVENRTAACLDSPASSLLCLAADRGLIHGRMDHHSPDFYINCWASAGLRLAAEAAAAVPCAADAARWSDLAAGLDGRIAARLLPAYGNPRDPVVTPYPTGALAAHRPELTARLAAWYRRERLTPEGGRKPEPLWTYFEAAQAHNAFLLGLREESWTSMQGMLASTGPWDVADFVEGQPDGSERLPFGNGAARRGWLDRKAARGGNMPHNWTTAEVLAWIRDALVREDGEGLLLGLGVPACWLRPGSRFGVRHMPTEHGPVSYTVDVAPDGVPHVAYEGRAPYRLALPGARR